MGAAPISAPTPPMTPLGGGYAPSQSAVKTEIDEGSARLAVKREGDDVIGEESEPKKRRIAPTLVVAPNNQQAQS